MCGATTDETKVLQGPQAAWMRRHRRAVRGPASTQAGYATIKVARRDPKNQVSGVGSGRLQRIRKPLLYPLSYEGARNQSSDLQGDPRRQGVARVDLRCHGSKL
jgi:hypothetical protein